MTRFFLVRSGLARFIAGCGAIAVAGLLAILIGCTPQGDPPGHLAAGNPPLSGPAGAPLPHRVVPHFTAHDFIAADGAALPLQVWLPKGKVRAVVLALHGFDDYSNAFAMPAVVWAKEGIATYAYDQRGFGAAPDRLAWPGSAALAADAAAASRALHRLYPQTPLYLLGESMGAAVAIVAETGVVGTPKPDVDGVILTAPAVWGRQTMTLPERVALWAGEWLFPGLRLTGEQLHRWPSDNIPMLEALARDPLMIRATRVGTVYGLVNLMSEALRSAPRLNVPLLVQYGAHDQIIPPEPVRQFVEDLPRDPACPRRLAYYPEGYHMLLRDLDGNMVAEDVASWVLDRGAPLPSRQDIAQNDRPWPPHRAGSG